MNQNEEWQVVRRTEVTIETHTVTTVRKRPSIDIGLEKSEPEPDGDVALLPELPGQGS
ncbi:MAG: hypothetical protein AB7J13_04180 [Pyrinomonadaceae bacterium]